MFVGTQNEKYEENQDFNCPAISNNAIVRLYELRT